MQARYALEKTDRHDEVQNRSWERGLLGWPVGRPELISEREGNAFFCEFLVGVSR